MKLRWALAFLTVAAGCGPTVTEMRQKQIPPRAENCELKLLRDLPVTAMAPGAEWDVIGNVIVHEAGDHDPFSEENKALVRPRACAMGGEAITTMSAASSGMVFGGGSSTNYMILRKATSAPPKEETF